MTDNSAARADDEPRRSPTEPYIQESALDPAGQHTGAQEEALAEQAQADEEDIECVGDETTALEVETGQTTNAGGKGTARSRAGEEAAARANAEVERGVFEEDSLAVAPDTAHADDDLDN